MSATPLEDAYRAALGNPKDQSPATELSRRVLRTLGSDIPELKEIWDEFEELTTQPGDRYCSDCGGLNPVWHAPNVMWNRVMGGPCAQGDPGGVVCPSCFIRRAERAGFAPASWLLTDPAHHD